MRRLPALVLACGSIALAALGAGCGEGGVSAGATVSIYVAAPLCNSAQRQLKREGATVSDLRIQMVCLPATEAAGRLDLAQTGSNARRATEDSTTIAFLEAAGPGAKFSQPIVESAEIGWTSSNSGSTAVHQVLEALSSNPSSPRAEVRESLDGSRHQPG